jgi:hypothetical protein
MQSYRRWGFLFHRIIVGVFIWWWWGCCCCSQIRLASAFYDGKSAAFCGVQTEWHKKYMDRHNDMLAGKIPAKFLISFPVKSGLSDMILGYISAFVWSVLTDRVHLIMRVPNLDGLCHQRSIEFGYQPRFENWTSFSIEKKHYECMMPPYPENITCTDSDDHPALMTFEYANGTRSPPLTMRHLRKVNDGFREDFKDKDMTRYPQKIHDADILMLSTNWGVSYNAFHNPYHHEALARFGFTNENLFPCLFNFLFKVRSEVCVGGCKTVERALHLYGKPQSKTVRIGVHFRLFKNEAPAHLNCLEQIVSAVKSKGLDYVILLTTPSTGLMQNVLEKYGSKLLLPQGKVNGITEVDGYDVEDTRPEGSNQSIYVRSCV